MLIKWTQARRSAIGLTRHKFRCHKRRAEYFKIEFHFTFEEWVAWWVHHLGPDWQTLRGNRLGQYVMGRKGDIGPYHPDNVMCITNTVNSQMAHIGRIQTNEHRIKNSMANRGEGNTRAKLTNEQVISIFTEKGTISSIARKYRVSRPVIRRIKIGKGWTHVTGAR